LLDSRLDWLRDGEHAELLRSGLRGLEKESLRVDGEGRLSRRPHPPALGSALTHPYLTTDYSEALLEFVTPPYPSNWEMLQFLCDIHCFVVQNLGDELIWAQSMPCVMSAGQDIPIAKYGGSNLGRMKNVYRRGLGHRYGRAMQAISGVHFNYSLPGDFWKVFRERERSSDSIEHFRSSQYMALVRNYRRHAWLMVYLFGATPALCKSFHSGGHAVLEELDASTWYAPYGTSLRMSDIGYRNKSQSSLHMCANSLEAYVAGLAAAVTTPNSGYEKIGVRVNGKYRQLNANALQIENEYYSSIRPKPRSGSASRPMVALREQGVEYVEIRTLDLNMLDPVATNQNQLRFLEAALIYCLLADSPPIDAAEQAEIDARELLVAREGRRPGLLLPRDGRNERLTDWGLELCEPIGEIAALLDVGDEGYIAAVQAQRSVISDPSLTPSAQILDAMKAERVSFLELTLEVSRNYCGYFKSLSLSDEKEALFRRLAERSLEDTRRLEGEGGPPFDEYLARYFERV